MSSLSNAARLFVAGALGVSVFASSGVAQVTPVQATAPAAAPAPPPPPQRLVARTMLGDAALIVNARMDGRIEIGAAGEGPVMDLVFPVGLVRLWVDSSAKVLRWKPRRRSDSSAVRSELEDPAVPAGMMSLSKRVVLGVPEFTLFFSDTLLNRVSVPITTEDAQVLVATMTRAVDAVRALREPPAPVRKPTRPPGDSAAKKPAKPVTPHAAPADTTRKPKPGT